MRHLVMLNLKVSLMSNLLLNTLLPQEIQYFSRCKDHWVMYRVARWFSSFLFFTRLTIWVANKHVQMVHLDKKNYTVQTEKSISCWTPIRWIFCNIFYRSKDINESVIFYIVRYIHSAKFLCVAKTLLLHVQNVVKLALVKINTGESSLCLNCSSKMLIIHKTVRQFSERKKLQYTDVSS